MPFAGRNLQTGTGVSVCRRGSARRIELSLGHDLPTAEIELPVGRTVRKGQAVHVRLLTPRRFRS